MPASAEHLRNHNVGDHGIININGGVVDEARNPPYRRASLREAFDVALDGLVDLDKVMLESYCIEQGSKVVSLFAACGHVGNPFPLK